MKENRVNYVEKPWGNETWITVTQHYALKLINLKKNSRTSLQYHNLKEEHIFVLSGKLSIEEDGENGSLKAVTYEPGEIAHYPALSKHRLSALEDSTFIEVSTPFMDDVVRVEDDYKRK